MSTEIKFNNCFVLNMNDYFLLSLLLLKLCSPKSKFCYIRQSLGLLGGGGLTKTNTLVRLIKLTYLTLCTCLNIKEDQL